MNKKTLSYPCRCKPKKDISAHLNLLEMYRDHLTQMRGLLKPKPVLEVAVCFLFLLDTSECHLENVSVAHIQTFITEQGVYYQRKTIATIASHLRSFLRFLAFKRLLPVDLSAAVKRPFMFQGEREPRYLQDWQVRKILSAMNRSTILEQRDYATILMLAIYGLRANEVAGLQFEDIRWRTRKVLIRNRKCGDSMELPLTPEVAEALIDYIRVRPPSDNRAVFLSHFSPYPPMSMVAVSIAATKAIRRSGYQVAHPGSHTFRYSRAQALFAEQYPLPDIASALGHRDLRTTLSYLSFTVHPLREVALNAGEELS
jgi:integrase/recombinase XerD